jgi:hypothetical protein
MRHGCKPQPVRLNNTDFRAIETRLLEWPGISREAINGERAAIERLVTEVAKTRARGTTSRKDVRADLEALRRHLQQAARLMQKGTVAPLMPALLGPLACNERPELGYAQVLDPQGFERGWWLPTHLPKTTSMIIGNFEYMAASTARQINQMSNRTGGGSIEDERGVPGANLICGAGALELVRRLGGQRQRSIRNLGTLCQMLWEVAGGKRSDAPNWRYVLQRILQEPREKQAERALFTARFQLSPALIADPS